MCQIRGVKTAAAERAVAQCGCHYLTDGAVCLCVLELGPRAQCRHIHTHTHTEEKTTESLLIPANQGWGMLLTRVCVCVCWCV